MGRSPTPSAPGGGARSPGDDLARGVLGLEPAWKWSAPAPAGLDHRLDDQVRFYAETMRAFNTETVRYLRDDLGCRQLINAGNWRTADPIRLYDAERWSYTAAEVMASNHFYSTPHVGPTQAYRIQRGDRYVDESALLHPRKLPFLARQVAGHPMIFSETAWVAPLTYISEGPFLVASYGSLLGLDGFYWLSMTEPGWGDADKPAYISAPVNKWKAGSPMTLGQFPAAALMYRRGSIERAEPAVAEVRAEADLWQRRPPVIVEDPGYDPVRDLGDAAERADLPSEVDPLAFLVGPVQVEYRKLSAPAKVADLDRFIDRRSKTVASSTGQIRLDYGKGVCTLDAPSAQGACGFLSASSPVDLSTVSIRSEDQYAAILAVALDDRPLAESASVLVQVGTRARPTGWAESPAHLLREGGQARRDLSRQEDRRRRLHALADRPGQGRRDPPQPDAPIGRRPRPQRDARTRRRGRGRRGRGRVHPAGGHALRPLDPMIPIGRPPSSRGDAFGGGRLDAGGVVCAF